MALISSILFFGQRENVNKNNKIYDPALARAMEYKRVGENDKDTASEYVKFDAFFLADLDGDPTNEADAVRGTCNEIGKEDTLYMELNVLTNGRLVDGKIEIQSDNFYLQTAIPKDGEVSENAVGNNTKQILLKDIETGTQKTLTGIVRSGDYSYESKKTAAIGNDTTKYSKENKIILTGTHIAEDGSRTQINKEVKFEVDWYGTVGAQFQYINQTKDISKIVDEEKQEVNLEFDIEVREPRNQLNISKSVLEGTVPELGGQKATRLEVTGTNVTFDWIQGTGKFTAQREAQKDEKGIITTSGYSSDYSSYKVNTYKLKVTYPLEAYQAIGENTIEYKIPVIAHYEGYNNTHKEAGFQNPYVSNTVKDTITINFRKPEGNVAIFDITVGRYVYSPTARYVISKKKPLNIYNEISETEKDDVYTVRWDGYTGTYGKSTVMIMKETEGDSETKVADQFEKSDGKYDSMEKVTTNVGIYFSNPVNLLGENGEIKVYDDVTGELLETFNKSNWNKYTSTNPYKYKYPVKHIRVETSATNENASISVYNIKELDDEYITTNYNRTAFDELQYIKSTLTGYLDERKINTDTHEALYEAPMSVVELTIDPSIMSTQETEKHAIITIKPEVNENYNEEKWSNGSFLLKIPEEILDIELNEVETTNESVTVIGSEIIEKEKNKYIKILTSNEEPASFEIKIDCNITPDPRTVTQTSQIDLYAINENCQNYYKPVQDEHDLNGNENKTEMIGHATTSVSLISPNSLLTNEYATDYDEKESEAVAPQVARVSKEQESAKVNIEIKNNYTSTISDIKILGRIPFADNKYVINGEELGSNFTTEIKEKIKLPADLADVATVYYSTNGEATEEINGEGNNWEEEPESFDNIKSYLIDLGDYQLQKQEKYVISYAISIPSGLNYNDVSYSHHAVYFSLDTKEGKYKTHTEPNKLGFMIAKQYDLELVKYQTGKDRIVPGATYYICEEGAKEGKTRVTDAQGKLTIPGLYAERTYIIREIKSPTEYELNAGEIKFKTKEENGKLILEDITGTRKEIEIINSDGENDYTVHVEVEDEAKAKLKIIKTDKESELKLSKVRYKITGDGLLKNGKILRTNQNGEVTLDGLKIGTEYTLEEIKADGYYLADPITFTINNVEGEYIVTITDGIDNSIQETEDIPTLTLNIKDDKIPTYNLEILKIEKQTVLDTEEGQAQPERKLLAGAKFKLYKDDKEIGEYTTNNAGKITIENLYQYEEDRKIDQTYTLKEVLSPTGYAKVKDITFKVQKSADGNTLEFVEELQEGQTAKKYKVEGNKVEVTIEDNPSFKLIKKDENGEELKGVKFAIYNVDDGETPAKNSKGEILGNKENINGRDYYVLETNEQGYLTADLPEGLYKAVEVEAPDKYDIKDNIYYFGIGASREGKTIPITEWGIGIGGTGDDRIVSIIATQDGGYIVGGNFSDMIQIDRNNTLISNGSDDGILIKYNVNNEVEWSKIIGGDDEDQIKAVINTSDGGYLVGGYFKSNTIDLKNDKTLINIDNEDGMVIKYSKMGEVEWNKAIGGTGSDVITTVGETIDGNYLVGGYFSETINLENNKTLKSNGSYDGMLIKYSIEGEAKWSEKIGGTSTDEITTVKETSDGGYLVGGYFRSKEIELGNEKILTNNTYYDDGMLIKYNSYNEVEWCKVIEGDYTDEITTVIETSDGGYLVGGIFSSYYISLESGKLLGNHNYDRHSDDGMLIKYSEDGIVEWCKAIGGKDDDKINKVIETKDGGYLACGYFCNSDIGLGNGNKLTNHSSYDDGMLIKYNKDGDVEWSKAIGGDYNDEITTVIETKDGRYLVGGYFSSTVNLENNKTLKSNGSHDGMLIKVQLEDVPEATIKQVKIIEGDSSDCVRTVIETTDGGYLVGGDFKSSTINLGDGNTLTNHSRYYSDGMIIKYNSDNEVEWCKAIGGDGSDYVRIVIEMTDGGYLVGGNFSSSKINLGAGSYTLTSHGSGDGMLIKYRENGEIEWCKEIGGNYDDEITTVIETSDGGYLVGGKFSSSKINLGAGSYPLTSHGSGDGMLIKYNANNEVEWSKVIGGNSIDEITTVKEMSDGGYLVGGYFSSTVNLENNKTLKSNGSHDGMLIKYSIEGKIEWGKEIGGTSGDSIETIIEMSDGGYLIGGYFDSREIELENEKKLINQDYRDGMLIKYNSNNEVNWCKEIGGNYNDEITTVTETSDGGCLVGGNFNSSTINLGAGSNTLSGSKKYDTGMLIKFSNGGEVEWSKSIGDEITTVIKISSGNYLVGGYFSRYINTGVGNESASGGSDGMILKVVEEMGALEVEKLEVQNKVKQFKITTDVQEINGMRGGDIDGEDKKPYETVEYDGTSKKTIKMTPESEYEIISVTVNGKEWKFDKQDDETYTMPPFEHMKEDKHVVVTYSKKSNKMVIKKVDSKTQKGIPGVKFQLDQIEERQNPQLPYTLTDNGQEYVEADMANLIEDEGVIGELEHLGTSEYYFVEDEEGNYVPTNSKSYSENNGTGKHNKTANSYIQIDLSQLSSEEKYVVVVNAKVSSQSYDYGYATITNDNTKAPSYNSTTGRFIYKSGNTDIEAHDYTSQALQGGQIYYLHLGYYKNGSTDTGEDQIVFNSVKVYKAKTVTYNFTESESGTYESTNQGKDNTECNSYIEIDLQTYTGKYNLTVNAEISTENGDYGYATITQNDTRPSYSSSTGQFIYITTKQDKKDYTTVLDGGFKYYLHLGYYKNGTTNKTGNTEDKFKVNSIDLTPNDSELYHIEVETNSEGKAITELPFGKYQITEIKVPDGYLPIEDDIIINFKENQKDVEQPVDSEKVKVNEIDGEYEYEIANKKKAKVTVHHLARENEQPVAPDEHQEGKVGEPYKTQPHLDLEKYELEKDEQGNQKIPEDANGEFGETDKEITYWYIKKKIPLTVHHYIEGTNTPVPLKDGNTAEDVTSKGEEGESYTTQEISDDELSEEYELSEVPLNAEGQYEGDEVIVTYKYKKVARKVTIVKVEEDEETPIQGAKFTIKNKTVEEEEEPEEYETDKKGKLNVTLEAGEYEITETKPAEGYQLPEDPTTEVTITKESSDQEIQIVNEKLKGRVIVHHYVYRTNNSVPSKVEGETVADEVKIGNIGAIFATQQSKDVSPKYEFVEADKETSGEYKKEEQVITYYYRTDQPEIDSQITKEGTKRITKKDAEVSYTVHYTATIEDYIGYATITIVDKLPYHIDEGASDKQDGVYDEDAKTLTWTEERKNINSYNDDGSNKIEIYKNLRLVFTDIDVKAENMTNEVTGTLKLQTPEKTDEKKATEETETDFKIDIPVEKIWVDKSDRDKQRPEELELVLKKDGIEEKTVTISSKKNQDEEDSNKWTYTFKDLPKYDENKEEIIYTVEERAKEKDDLKYYNPQIDGENVEEGVKITNTIDYGKVTVHHYIFGTDEKVPSKNGKVVEDELIEGNVGEEYHTKQSDQVSPNYEYVITEGNEDGEIQEDPTEVTYYYRLKEPKVTETDVIKEAPSIVTRKNEKVPYTIKYVAVVDEYIGDATVIIVDKLPYHIDEKASDLANGKYNAENRTITWVENISGIDTYESQKNVIKVIKEIELVYTDIDITKDNMTNSVTGSLDLLITKTHYDDEDEAETKVEIPGEVIVKYKDKNTDEEIEEPVRKEDKVGNKFDVEEDKKEIPGYTLVEEPEEKTGTYGNETQEKTYYYAKNTTVHVTYVDKLTKEEIAKDELIEGYEGKEYTTEQKEIENYKFVESTDNTEGKMTIERIEVIYYYVRPAKVVVRHVEKETEKDLIEPEEIPGYQDDEYTTEEKHLKFYNLIEKPENAEGNMTVTVERDKDGKITINDVTYVIYYYEKKPFNLKLEKKMDSIILNGKTIKVNGDLGKAEVYRKAVNTSKIEVVYTLKVTNTGELAGKGTIRESIPSGMTMEKAKNTGWRINDSKAMLETENINPGETKEYKVRLTWKSNATNLGQKTNIAEIISTENEAGFEETIKVDNVDTADLIIAVGTGNEIINEIMISTGIIAIMLIGLISLAKWTRRRK